MNALLSCVNGGGLPGGIADMYDENIRNSIINGMSLCKSVVDKCIADIGVYHSASDVWIDFNSRVIQPQYYSFVLRKTGLTPNQAENTCLLLDTNTYGKSFGAVNDAGTIQGEYREVIGAYNQNTDLNSIPDQNVRSGAQVQAQGRRANDNPIVVKLNPLGIEPLIGNPDYDGRRGHYARWDATTGECLVRVAAYNKDELITNRWLGIGDDKAAEVWRPAGSSFSCNKELFEFGLMNQTKSAALLGTTIGTGVGVGVGIGVGSAIDSKSVNNSFCADEKNLAKLAPIVMQPTNLSILNEFLSPKISSSVGRLTMADCSNILKLFEKYSDYRAMVDDGMTRCSGGSISIDCKSMIAEEQSLCATATRAYTIAANAAGATYGKAVTAAWNSISGICPSGSSVCIQWKSEYDAAKDSDLSIHGCRMFKSMSLAYTGTNLFCDDGGDCVPGSIIERQVERLGGILNSLDIYTPGTNKPGMSNLGKGALIGGATGLAAGGLATAITAFVEKNNISCHVGDGLDRVQLSKSGSIDSLKNYYVKWKLNLPDTIGPAPTTPVADCDTWISVCESLTSISDCITATLPYRADGENSATMVYNACAVEGGKCTANRPVAVSQGACAE
jgi:hypothetical protein